MNSQEQTWANFELGEDVRDEERLEQDKKWSQAVIDGRGHLSHRELTVLFAKQFLLAIDDFKIVEDLILGMYNKKSILSKIDSEILRIIVEYAIPNHGPQVMTSIIRKTITPKVFSQSATMAASDKTFPFRICVRKRPLFAYEAEYGAFDVCDTTNKNHVILHEGKLARNGRHLSMTHHQFVFDQVFGEDTSNHTVCEATIDPLVEWALKGFTSSFICFGQTGTGKTYTLYAALEHIGKHLIGKSCRITFYEVYGKKCHDLLRDRAVVHLRSDENDNMHVRGATQVVLSRVHNEMEFLTVLKHALKLRSSTVTERNPISSRSHAVCVIEIADAFDPPPPPPQQAHKKPQSLQEYLDKNNNKSINSSNSSSEHSSENDDSNNNIQLKNGVNPANSENIEYTSAATTVNNAKNNSNESNISASSPTTASDTSTFTSTWFPSNNCGKITLVDLAGSERNYETVQMTAVQHKQSAEINAALMTLKECFRAYHANAYKDINEVLLSTKPVNDGRKNQKLSTADLIAATNSNKRIPYRDSLLTKVLKECFTSGPYHHTTIMATISPSPVDLYHTINTLSHVVLMSPNLYKRIDRLQVEVPMSKGVAMNNLPLSQWNAAQVKAWISVVEEGRFAQLALPHGITGAELMQLSETNLAELFTQRHNVARQETEGAAWVEKSKFTRKMRDIGRALWCAIHREEIVAQARLRSEEEENNNVTNLFFNN